MSKKDKINQEETEDTCCCNHDGCCCEENNECHCDEECNCHEDECCCQHNDINIDKLLATRIKTLEDALLRSQAELLNYKKEKMKKQLKY